MAAAGLRNGAHRMRRLDPAMRDPMSPRRAGAMLAPHPPQLTIAVDEPLRGQRGGGGVVVVVRGTVEGITHLLML